MSCGEREPAAGQTSVVVVESLFSAEQSACQAKQSADLTAKQTAAVEEEGRRLGNPTLAFPCWQIIWKARNISFMSTTSFRSAYMDLSLLACIESACLLKSCECSGPGPGDTWTRCAEMSDNVASGVSKNTDSKLVCITFVGGGQAQTHSLLPQKL